MIAESQLAGWALNTGAEVDPPLLIGGGDDEHQVVARVDGLAEAEADAVDRPGPTTITSTSRMARPAGNPAITPP